MSINHRSDERFIKLALQLAKRGIGQTGSNPSVGCIIVRGNRIVGRGRTGLNGIPHAETAALNHARGSTKGATMFLTLEPCSHHGKTPPCVESIINSKIARVVCPIIDPDVRVSGRGFKRLKHAKVKVDLIPMARLWAEEAARGFLSRVTKRRPFTTVKLAMSIDGKIASHDGKSKWITNKFLRARSHLLRVQNDAILIGTNTFYMDNPSLNARGTFENLLNPLRIFLDHDLRVFPSDPIIRNLARYPSILVCGQNPDAKHLKIWQKTNVEILQINSLDKKIDLTKLFNILAKRGINSLLVEGGGKLVSSLLKAKLIDELVIHRSGFVLGSDGIPSVFKFEKISEGIDAHPRMTLKSLRQFDDNLETIWRPI